MINYREIEREFAKAIGLDRRPVAVLFRDDPPQGVAKFDGSEPAGCSYWRLAAGGRTFYTTPSDHFNCPIGSYTHAVDLPPDRAPDLMQTLTFMSDIGYIRMEEVPAIPRLPRTPKVIVYAPLGDTPSDPDVVLFSGRAGRVMLLQEAAARAGVAAQVPLFGRPTCMAIPAALASGVVASTGCIGNRVYTGIGEDELYVAVPGRDVQKLAAEAQTIAGANAALFEYHQGRRQSLSTE
jgi:uncharacterized protein (DUF169 family)